MYNNPYMQSLNQQSFNDRIDNEIERLRQMKTQIQQPIQQPTNLTQNFQLAPTHSGIKYANTIEDVRKDMVYVDTPYFTKDLSVMWLKNTKGDIKAYELKEIVQKDDKDIQIEYLMNEIEELKKGMSKYEQHNTNANRENVSTSTTNDNETIREQVEDDKPTNVQRVPTSKKR